MRTEYDMSSERRQHRMEILTVDCCCWVVVAGRLFGSGVGLEATDETVGTGSRILIPEGGGDVGAPAPGSCSGGVSWRRMGTTRGGAERFLIILRASWMCSARRTGGGPIAWRAFAGWDIATGPTMARAARKKIVDFEEGIIGVWWTVTLEF